MDPARMRLLIKRDTLLDSKQISEQRKIRMQKKLPLEKLLKFSSH